MDLPTRLDPPLPESARAVHVLADADGLTVEFIDGGVLRLSLADLGTLRTAPPVKRLCCEPVDEG